MRFVAEPKAGTSCPLEGVEVLVDPKSALSTSMFHLDLPDKTLAALVLGNPNAKASCSWWGGRLTEGPAEGQARDGDRPGLQRRWNRAESRSTD
jgi:hypothetical protein